MLKMNKYVRRRSLVLSAPIQIALALAICVAVPLTATTLTSPLGWSDVPAQTSALSAAVALLLGFWLHRSVSAVPGTSESAGITPSYLISFGAVLVVILMARLSYSRTLLASAFVLSVTWNYLTYLVIQRRAVLHLGIVRGGKTDALSALTNVIAIPLEIDSLPDRLDAVSADFRYPHSPEWEARLADYVLAGVPVYHAKNLLESLTGRSELEHLSENTFGALGPLPPFLRAKRGVDWIFALLAMVVFAPLMLAVALWIKVDSPGPVLFRQARVGFRGRIFTVFKFRTMRSELVPGSDRAQFITSLNDGRITRAGKVLRKTRIDELPQIINILRGEMSWIGPRPEAAMLSEWYTQEIPFYRYRHVVYPGITGWAQVTQGHVSEVDEVKGKLEYDFYYIRNFSVWLDLLIIAKTLRTMMTGFGHR